MESVSTMWWSINWWLFLHLKPVTSRCRGQDFHTRPRAIFRGAISSRLWYPARLTRFLEVQRSKSKSPSPMPVSSRQFSISGGPTELVLHRQQRRNDRKLFGAGCLLGGKRLVRPGQWRGAKHGAEHGALQPWHGFGGDRQWPLALVLRRQQWRRHSIMWGPVRANVGNNSGR